MGGVAHLEGAVMASKRVRMSQNACITLDVNTYADGIRMTSAIGGSGMIISIPSPGKAQELIDALTRAKAERWPS